MTGEVNRAQQSIRKQEEQRKLTVNAEGELTVAWGWVLVGTALSQVIGAPIAAGRRQHTSAAWMPASSCLLRSQSLRVGLSPAACKLALKSQRRAACTQAW